MRKLGFAKMGFVVSVFCATTAIAVSAQTFSTQVNFNGSNGAQPAYALVQGFDGDFYGTTAGGGSTSDFCVNGCGTFFKVTAAGELTTLYRFCSQVNCNDGVGPEQVVLGSDGNFYGTTSTGGANCHELSTIGCGTVFKITAAGKLTTLYSFCSDYPTCTDGWGPNPVVQGADGNLYGTTYFFGGAKGFGTAFKITPGGVLTTLHSFCSEGGKNCTDGVQPESLMQANNGKFYGTTYSGGTNGTGCGVVFEMTPAGAVTTLHSFDNLEGCWYHFPKAHSRRRWRPLRDNPARREPPAVRAELPLLRLRHSL